MTSRSATSRSGTSRSAASRSATTHARHDLPVLAPYRLDLTVSALRRLSTNVVDLLTAEGAYVRALGGARAPVFVHVAQTRPDLLTVAVEGSAADHAPALALVRRMLGVDRDLTPFYRAAARVPWLAPLAHRMRGVKPPRYPTLWEACVSVIVFQQVSLFAASAVMRRLVVALGSPLEHMGATLYTFPSAESVLEADDDLLRAVGLSAGKLATLRRVGEALASGTLSETLLEGCPSPDAAALLQRIKGIGPWTAAVVLIRGFGRLDVFPMKDSSVARNLTMVAGPAPRDVAGTLAELRPQQGMLYYHLLLARLEVSGDLGRTSESALDRASDVVE